jgi:acyl-CoA thioester hydrolase
LLKDNLTTAITSKVPLQANSEKWHDYPVVVYPHHTDYGGIVWHGQYIVWLEEARIECLNALGISFAELVSLGYDLPVVELSLRYHKSLKLGESALVRTRMTEIEGVKIHCDYKIESPTSQDLYLTGRVTLVTVDRARGKIMRQLPPALKDIFLKLTDVSQ